jgi:hypothetical protein
MQFRTHTGETVSGERLAAACAKAADDLVNLAMAIREEDAYASHVTEEEKDAYMFEMVARAERVRSGDVYYFGAWQDVNSILTGECVPMLAKNSC